MAWQLVDRRTKQVVFESDDRQAFIDEADRLQAAEPDAPFGIEGDPFELGVVQALNPDGSVARGPERLRTPTGADG